MDYSGSGSSDRTFILFSYNTEHLLKKDKVRFYYALKGRDGKSGIVRRTRAEHIGKGVILVSSAYDQEFQQFFRVWKTPFTRRKMILLEEVQG